VRSLNWTFKRRVLCRCSGLYLGRASRTDAIRSEVDLTDVRTEVPDKIQRYIGGDTRKRMYTLESERERKFREAKAVREQTKRKDR
jgi:hypothetical protein